MKTIKKLIIVCALIAGCFFISCSKSSEEQNGLNAQKKMTKAEALVTSVEYQAYETMVQRLINKVSQNISKLSAKEQDLFFTKIKECQSMSDVNQISQTLKEAEAIVGIDFQKEINDIRRKSTSVVADINGLSKRDLIIAVKKNQISTNLRIIPLVKSATEVDPNAEDRQLCELGCQGLAALELVGCALLTPIPGAICAAAVVANTAAEIAKCAEKYPYPSHN